MADFLNNARSRSYTHTFSLLDDNKGESSTKAAAKFKTLRIAFFVNDEVKVTDNFTLNLAYVPTIQNSSPNLCRIISLMTPALPGCSNITTCMVHAQDRLLTFHGHFLRVWDSLQDG
jgi:hypothetical protein